MKEALAVTVIMAFFLSWNWMTSDPIEDLLYEDFIQLLGFSDETSFQVMKWADPIRYKIIYRNGMPSSEIVDKVHNALQDFSRYSGVPVGLSSEQETPNFKVMFNRPNGQFNTFNTPDHIGRDRMNRASCYAMVDDGLDYRKGIQAMMIVLPNNNDNQALKCLEHELMHAFGFWQHVPWREEYSTTLSLGLRRHAVKVTPADALWIKALYSPEIAPGADKSQIEAVARQTINRVYREAISSGAPIDWR